MKKNVSLLCLSLLLIGLSFPAPITANEATIHTDHLNVRSGPGTDYDKVGQVDTDEVYTVLSMEDNWVEINLGDDSGWITTEYVTLSKTDSETATDDVPDKSTDSNKNDDDTDNNTSDNSDSNGPGSDVVILKDNTQIRDEPSTNGEIIYFASDSESFTVLSETDDWLEIENSETKGYVHQRLLNNEKKDTVTGLRNKTIMLDAGHGGRDVGAIGASGRYEKSFTYMTTQELKKELELLGANVILTRDTDEFISLGGRTSLSNVNDTDAFISIHYNSTPDLPEVSGIGTYYYHDQHEKLANDIQNGVIQTTDADDRDVAFENFHVIRQSFKPSILIELGFISNEEEENLLKGSPYQKKIVTGIIHGLQRYFNE